LQPITRPTWRLRRQHRDTSSCRLVKVISSRLGITGTTQIVESMSGSRATTKPNGAASTSCRIGGLSKTVAIISRRGAGKRTTRVSDRQGNRHIEEAPLVGAFLWVLPGDQAVRRDAGCKKQLKIKKLLRVSHFERSLELSSQRPFSAVPKSAPTTAARRHRGRR
jgi:hypothetical protein